MTFITRWCCTTSAHFLLIYSFLMHCFQVINICTVFMANLGQNGINLITVSQMAAKFKQMFSDHCGFMN